jgi:hypothetical protein
MYKYYMKRIHTILCVSLYFALAATIQAEGLPKSFGVGDEVVIIWQVNNVLAGGSPFPYKIQEIDGKWIKMTCLEGEKKSEATWANSDYIAIITLKTNRSESATNP